MSRSLWAAVLIVSLGALIIGTAIAISDGDTIYPGVRMGGDDLGGLTIEQAESRLAARTAEATEERIVLRYNGETLNTTIMELGCRPDMSASVQAAYLIGRKGNILKRIGGIISARRGRLQLPIIYSFDDKQASQYLQSAARRINRQPADARLIVEGGSVRVLPEQSGLRMDVGRSLKRISQAINSGAKVVDLIVNPSMPKITTADLQGIDSVISSYSTPYKPWQRDRTHNLKIACRAIDGTIVRTGEAFSYNKVVGPRLKKYGFRDAPIFVNGEIEPGTGGGVCQVSTTVYNAALLANMKILKRFHHSRPVVYVPVGRDATVAYPSVDLQFENTSGAPIYIIAWVGKRTVDVTFLSRKQSNMEVAIIAVGHKIIGIPEEEKVQEDIEPGKRVVLETGLAGHRISIYRIVKVDGRVVKRELVSNDYYRPQSRVIGVPEETEPPPAVPM